MSETKPQCLKCNYYFSTYDPQVPRGCKAYKFRSLSMPSFVVKRETGEECAKFAVKVKKEPSKKSIDLNDPDLW